MYTTCFNLITSLVLIPKLVLAFADIKENPMSIPYLITFLDLIPKLAQTLLISTMFYFQTQLKLETNTNVRTMCKTIQFAQQLLILILNDPNNLYKYIQKGRISRKLNMKDIKHEGEIR
jgi:hypothetical protein